MSRKRISSNILNDSICGDVSREIYSGPQADSNFQSTFRGVDLPFCGHYELFRSSFGRKRPIAVIARLSVGVIEEMQARSAARMLLLAI